MRMLSKAFLPALILVASAQERGQFQPRPASTYAARQTIDKVTIAVEPYEGREKIKQAFGKVDMIKYGVLPILVVIANDSNDALQVDAIQVRFITGDGQKVEPIPAEDVLRSGTIKRPDMTPRTPPFPGIGRGGRGSQDSGEVEARQFVAPMVPPHGAANGFFYFRMGKGPDRIPGSKFYITGIRNARTGRDLLYFEIGLNESSRNR